jgi:transcriptional regulator with XRE-family HTH domain
METSVFIENLKYVFKNHGITKAFVAKKCGVSKATVSMWLAGRKPYRQSIEVIANLISSLLFIKVTPEDLMEQDINKLLRQNEVKIFVIRKLVVSLSDLSVEELVALNEYVQGLLKKETNIEKIQS